MYTPGERLYTKTSEYRALLKTNRCVRAKQSNINTRKSVLKLCRASVDHVLKPALWCMEQFVPGRQVSSVTKGAILTSYETRRLNIAFTIAFNNYKPESNFSIFTHWHHLSKRIPLIPRHYSPRRAMSILKREFSYLPAVHGAMGCGQTSFKTVWRCHQLLSGFLAKGHLPRVAHVGR